VVWSMVCVHRDKLFKALDMLASGKTTREVAKETGLSFTQLKDIRKTLPKYVEVKEFEEKFLEPTLKIYKELKEHVSKLKIECTMLEHKKLKLKHDIEILERERNLLEQKLRDLKNSAQEVLGSIRLNLLNTLRESHREVIRVLENTRLSIYEYGAKIYTPKNAERVFKEYTDKLMELKAKLEEAIKVLEKQRDIEYM